MVTTDEQLRMKLSLIFLWIVIFAGFGLAFIHQEPELQWEVIDILGSILAVRG